jgi:hypothetical protein
LGNEKQLLTEDQLDPEDEVKRVHSMFNSCAAEELPPPGKDMSAMAWLKSKGATPKMVRAQLFQLHAEAGGVLACTPLPAALQLAVAEACHANDFCGPLEHIGLREMIHEDRR